MRVKSISDLAFRVLVELTDDEDELLIAHAIFNCEASRTGDIQRIMKQDCRTPYYTVQRFLRDLVNKNIIHRLRIGVYEPNLKMLLPKMIEILEARAPDKAGEENTQSHMEAENTVMR